MHRNPLSLNESIYFLCLQWSWCAPLGKNSLPMLSLWKFYLFKKSTVSTKPSTSPSNCFFTSQPRKLFFFFFFSFLFFYLWWILSYIKMKQSWVYIENYFKSSPISTQTSTLHTLSFLFSISYLTIQFIKTIETNRQELPQLSNNLHSFSQYVWNTTGYLGSGTRSPTFSF